MPGTNLMSPDGKHASVYTGLVIGPDRKLYAATSTAESFALIFNPTAGWARPKQL